MNYTNDILEILSSELEPYVSHGGEACIDGVLTSAQKLNEFLQQKLQKTLCSTSLPPSDYDLERLYDWIMDENRKSAKTAFTSGSLRKVADEIEFRLWRQLR